MDALSTNWYQAVCSLDIHNVSPTETRLRDIRDRAKSKNLIQIYVMSLILQGLNIRAYLICAHIGMLFLIVFVQTVQREKL